MYVSSYKGCLVNITFSSNFYLNVVLIKFFPEKYKIKSNKRTYKNRSKRKGRGGGKIADMSKWIYMPTESGLKSAIRATPAQQQLHMKEVEGTRSRLGEMNKVKGTLYQADGTPADESSHDEGVIPVVNKSNREGNSRMVGFADEYGRQLYMKKVIPRSSNADVGVKAFDIVMPLYKGFVCERIERAKELEKKCLDENNRGGWWWVNNASDSYKIKFSKKIGDPNESHVPETKYFWIRWGDIQKIKKVYVYNPADHGVDQLNLPKKTKLRKLFGWVQGGNISLRNKMSDWWKQFNHNAGNYRIFPDLVTIMFTDGTPDKSLKESLKLFEELNNERAIHLTKIEISPSFIS